MCSAGLRQLSTTISPRQFLVLTFRFRVVRLHISPLSRFAVNIRRQFAHHVHSKVRHQRQKSDPFTR